MGTKSATTVTPRHVQKSVSKVDNRFLVICTLKFRGYRQFVGLCNLPLVRIGNSHLGVAESSFVSQPVGVTFGELRFNLE